MNPGAEPVAFPATSFLEALERVLTRCLQEATGAPFRCRALSLEEASDAADGRTSRSGKAPIFRVGRTGRGQLYFPLDVFQELVDRVAGFSEPRGGVRERRPLTPVEESILADVSRLTVSSLAFAVVKATAAADEQQVGRQSDMSYEGLGSIDAAGGPRMTIAVEIEGAESRGTLRIVMPALDEWLAETDAAKFTLLREEGFWRQVAKARDGFDSLPKGISRLLLRQDPERAAEIILREDDELAAVYLHHAPPALRARILAAVEPVRAASLIRLLVVPCRPRSLAYVALYRNLTREAPQPGRALRLDALLRALPPARRATVREALAVTPQRQGRAAGPRRSL